MLVFGEATTATATITSTQLTEMQAYVSYILSVRIA